MANTIELTSDDNVAMELTLDGNGATELQSAATPRPPGCACADADLPPAAITWVGDALKLAAALGHLDVARSLVAASGLGPRWLAGEALNAAAVEAATAGHGDIVVFLMDILSQSGTSRFPQVLHGAMRGGHAALVRQISERYPAMLDDQRAHCENLEAAAAGGSLEICRGFEEAFRRSAVRSNGGRAAFSLCAAAEGGHLGVCKWLMEFSCFDFGALKDAMGAAARAGHYEVATWLWTRAATAIEHIEFRATEANWGSVSENVRKDAELDLLRCAMQNAALGGNVRLYVWVLQNRGCWRGDGFREIYHSALEAAAASGSLAIGCACAEYHASPGIPTKLVHKCLQKAAHKGHPAFCDWLIARFDVGAQDVRDAIGDLPEVAISAANNDAWPMFLWAVARLATSHELATAKARAAATAKADAAAAADGAATCTPETCAMYRADPGCKTPIEVAAMIDDEWEAIAHNVHARNRGLMVEQLLVAAAQKQGAAARLWRLSGSLLDKCSGLDVYVSPVFVLGRQLMTAAALADADDCAGLVARLIVAARSEED